jgi:hypothetical protein
MVSKDNQLILLISGQRIINVAGGVAFGLITNICYGPDIATDIYVMFGIGLAFLVFESGLPILIVQRVASSSTSVKIYIKHYMFCISLMASIFFIFLILVGVSISRDPVSHMAWIVLAIFAPLTMVRSAVQSYFEGKRRLLLVAQERLIQAAGAYIVLVIGLLLDWAYWAVPSYYIAFAVIPLILKFAGFKKTSVRNGYSLIGFCKLKYSRKQFEYDKAWQSELIFQSASTYFSNQLWIVSLGIAGYDNITPVVGFLNQIAFSIVGFSTMLVSTKLSYISFWYSTESHEVFLKNIRPLLISSSYVFSIFLVFASLFYYFFPKFFSDFADRFVGPGEAWPYFFIAFFSFVFSMVVILENSKGKISLYKVHIIRILLSSIFCALFFILDVEEYVPVLYLVFWVLILFFVKILKLRC